MAELYALMVHCGRESGRGSVAMTFLRYYFESAGINAMRHEGERSVKPPGADLKSAPFRTAAKVKTLAAYTEVVIVIVTPRWYGVETPDGQRGWMPADQLETLP